VLYMEITTHAGDQLNSCQNPAIRQFKILLVIKSILIKVVITE